MADSIWVLTSRELLPRVNCVAEAIESSPFPLTISADWAWVTDAGWLSLKWRSEDAGFELEFEDLESDQASAASKSGFPGANCAVILTVRGWASLQSAAAFAANVAILTKGCIWDGEEEYVPHTEALQWASNVIEEVDASQRMELAQVAAREAARSEADLDVRFSAALHRCAGQCARFTLIRSSLNRIHYGLGVVLQSGSKIHGGTWDLKIENRCLQHSRYNAVRASQHSRMKAWERELTEEQWENWDLPEHIAIEAQGFEFALAQAAELDQRDGEEAVEMIGAWPSTIEVADAKWILPHEIEVHFAWGGNPVLKFIGGGLLSTVTLLTPPLRFELAEALRLS